MSRNVIVPLPAASGQLANGSGCLLMQAARETTGAASAVYKFFDGSGTGGLLALPISLTAGQSTRDFIRNHTIPFRQGLFFQLVSGTIEGSVSIWLDHDCKEYWANLERQLLAHP